MKAGWMKTTGELISRNSPEILSGIAIAGVIGTVILAVKATPKALKQIEEAEPSEIVLNRQRALLVWRHYIPAGIAGVTTIGCIIGANRAGASQAAALGAAYTLVDQTFREYKAHVLDEIGEAKERKIGDKVMQDRIESSPPKDGQVIITGGGDQLCFESLSGRYFQSDIEKIRRAENEFNAKMLHGDAYLPLDVWFEFLGLGHTDLGDVLGWNIEHLVKCIFSSHLHPDSGQPCLAIRYEKIPEAGYSKCF